jgi:hypothetical protein
MKVATAQCSFKLYNPDNQDGSDTRKYYVSHFSCSAAQGPISDAVSGEVFVDQIAMDAFIAIVFQAITYNGTASFVFPARHWAFMLDGHATLAEGDAVQETIEFNSVNSDVSLTRDFVVVAEIGPSEQSAYEDWSQT